MSVLQRVLISALSSGTVGGLLIAFSNFLSGRSNEHLRGELSKDLESSRNVFQLEPKKLQAVLDQRHFVSRARLDAEFVAMKELHEGASKVQLAIIAIRPSLDYGPAFESDIQFMERVNQRVRHLAAAHDSLLALQENQRRFYSDELYLAISECTRLARTETVQAGRSRAESHVDWYEQGNRNVDAYAVAYSRVLGRIRDRIRVLESSSYSQDSLRLGRPAAFEPIMEPW